MQRKFTNVGKLNEIPTKFVISLLDYLKIKKKSLDKRKTILIYSISQNGYLPLCFPIKKCINILSSPRVGNSSFYNSYDRNTKVDLIKNK